MNNSALIYIPDISGFTKFVAQTEIEHSQHIIAELISIIINQNNLGFNVSEIEGDAVLFFKKGDPPALQEIIEQTKKMFVEFHRHLENIKSATICQCGACQSVGNLSLKFITHFGDIKEVSIDKFDKIMGSDVILAHRLLKNNVQSHEYLLLTVKYLKTQREVNKTFQEFGELQTNIESIENFGDVVTKYVTLSHLKKIVKKNFEQNQKTASESKLNSVVFINAPKSFVYQAIIDIKLKLKWVKGIKDIRVADKINRVNTTHTCLFEKNEINFETLRGVNENNVLIYSEKAVVAGGLSFELSYSITEKEKRTQLSLSIIKNKSVKKERFFLLEFYYYVASFVREYFFFRAMKKSLEQFKKYCESK